MAPNEIMMNLGLQIGWRAKALLRWYGFLHRLGFKVDVERAAERIAAQMLIKVDGKSTGKLGRRRAQ
jgi:hypothetical protein